MNGKAPSGRQLEGDKVDGCITRILAENEALKSHNVSKV